MWSWTCSQEVPSATRPIVGASASSNSRFSSTYRPFVRRSGAALGGQVRHLCQLAADLIRFWGANASVEGQGLPPLAAGLAEVAQGVLGVAEAVMRPGLLAGVAELAGKGERLDVPCVSVGYAA